MVQKTLTNVATQRLKGHRNLCKKPDTQENDPYILVFAYDEDIDDEEVRNVQPSALASESDIDIDFDIVQQMDISSNSNGSFNTSDIELPARPSSGLSTTRTTTSDSSISSTPVASCSSPFSGDNFRIPSAKIKTTQNPNANTKSKKNSTSKLKNFMDSISIKEEEEINELIGKFFYGCNILLSVIDASPFKNLIKKLRPAYAQIMPKRKALSTKLLDNEYQKQIERGKESIGPESVLLIDGWKNTASNSKTVVTMLHNANGEKVFLNAWDLSGEPETAERLSEIVDESVGLALEMYNTKIHTVVSNNAAAMMKLHHFTALHSNCSAHVANLLAKSVLNKELVEDVTSILKEFRHVDLEKLILEKGGTKIKIPAQRRWCSHRYCFVCSKTNLTFMRQIVADSNRKIKQNIKNLLFDDEFIEGVDRSIKLLDPICTLLNKVQSSSCSVAEGVSLWLSLTPPEEIELKLKFDSRAEKALNVYALSAYYLHPYYCKEKLSVKRKNVITDFLFKILDGQGLRELDLFINFQGYFNLLKSKNLESDALLFWRMASLKYPNISKLALKLLSIPASSAQIERLFSNWSYIHSDIMNRLTFERSKKLVSIYYNMKINNTIEEELEEDY